MTTSEYTAEQVAAIDLRYNARTEKEQKEAYAALKLAFPLMLP